MDKEFLVGFLKRLTSRKFLLALAAMLVGIANQEWNTVIAVVLGYLGAEGASDALEKLRS